MSRLLPLNMLAACCILYACNQPNTTTLRDSPDNYKKYWDEYNYAMSLLGAKDDSAFFHFSHIANNSKDSLLVAGSYTEMAIIQNDAGDYYGSQESLLSSLQILNENERQHQVYLAYAYNELGLNSISLKNFDDAIKYQNDAIRFSSNDSGRLIIMNNKANAYKGKQQYDTSIAIYNEILPRLKNTPRQYARTLSNKTYTQWLQNSNYNAGPELWTAMQIRKEEKDERGLIASYKHLSEYYKKIRPDSALFYAHQLYAVTSRLKTFNDELEALSILIPLTYREESKKYFTRHQFLSDSLQTARNSAKNQFAVIRYETEKHKTDKLKLQKENAEAQLRVVWLRVGSVALVIVAITGFVWYRKRKQQAIKEQQLRMSQKVHDKVANRVYRIMSEVEHQGVPEKSILLQKLDTVYQQSRDISYDQPNNRNHDFQQSIAELLQSFASTTVRIASVGNSESLWNKVAPVVKEELTLILEEFLTNMKKHSKANNVVVKFMQKDNTVEVHYSDDGIGISNEVSYGNGLRNTESRIKDISGTIIFDRTKPGLKIRIIIPIEK